MGKDVLTALFKVKQLLEIRRALLVERRHSQQEFVARGLRARDESRKLGDYVSAATALAGLERKLVTAKTIVKQKTGATAKAKSSQ